MPLYATVPNWIKEIPDDLKTQEMWDEALHMDPHLLEFVPDYLKTQEMCNETVRSTLTH